MDRSSSILLIPFCVLAFAGAMFAADNTTIKGYVNDAACGIKNKTNVECARKCIGKGAKMVVVTDDDKVLTVNNPTALKGREGQHVAVTGKVTGSSIDVDRVNEF